MRLIGLIFVMILSASADTIQWVGHYDRALSRARQEHKLLLVLAVKPHCPACSRLVSRILQDPVLTRQIQDKYVSVIVTNDRYRDYPNELYFASRYPALFVVDPKDERFVMTPFIGVSIKDLAPWKDHRLNIRRKK
jgi:thioredoxin-related protein